MKNEQLKQALEQAVNDRNPEYRIVKFVEPGQNPKTASLQECGVLTCCEYDNGSEECYQ